MGRAMQWAARWISSEWIERGALAVITAMVGIE